jgi:protein-tyrosine-phosphatase
MADKVTRDKPYNVLFLCTGNSARSIMAEAIMNRFGAGKFEAYSAGSMPKGEVHPRTVQILKAMNFKPELFRSKSWEEFSGPDAPKLDFVFTVCDNAANEVCPIWPGQPMSAHWGVPDPAAAEGTEAQIAYAFSDTWRMLQSRINIFIALPISGLDRLSLQTKLDAIGKIQNSPAEPTT